MLAWRLHELGDPWDVLKLEDVPSPVPGSTEARIAVEACDLNFADILQCQGTYQERIQPPFTPGMSAAGTVVEVGADCALAEGDRVIGLGHKGWGGYAQEAVVTCATVRAVPADVPLPTAVAAYTIFGTAWFSLVRRGQMKAGETVLVLAAAGGVGSAAVSLAKAAGCVVIAAAGGDAKVEVCRQLGADVVIDYDAEDLRDAVLRATDGRGCDIVYDPVGGDYFDAARRVVAWEGRLLVVGFASGKIPSAPANHVLVKNYSVVGVHMGGYRGRMDAVADECFAELWPQIASGDIAPLVSRELPLAELPDGLRALAGRQTTGRVLLRPDLG